MVEAAGSAPASRRASLSFNDREKDITLSFSHCEWAIRPLDLES